MKRAVVIIPTYNERENIGKTVERLIEVFKKISDWSMKILVVDDTSPDKTYELVSELKKKNRYLELLINSKKSGLGGAYLKGMDHAFKEMGADVVFEFDADLSHDPTKIPLFLEKIEEGYDLVLGSRYIPGGSIPEDWGWHRKLLSRLGNFVIMVVMLNFKIRDWTSGYRALTKELYSKVSPLMRSERFSGYTFQIGFLVTTLSQGFKVSESVPYVFIDRTIGESKLGPEYIKNTLIYIMKVRMKLLLENRIFKFLMVGGIGALLQLLTLQLYRSLIPDFNFGLLTPYLLATFLSIETSILSNFLLSNLWTFADRKLRAAQMPAKFLQFNLTSAGSILIQLIIAFLGQNLIGIIPLFIVPMIGYPVDTGVVYAVVGILAGMFWNYFAYNKFIWKK